MTRGGWFRRIFLPHPTTGTPPTVPWTGPITFRCERCGEHHDGDCPPRAEPESTADHQ